MTGDRADEGSTVDITGQGGGTAVPAAEAPEELLRRLLWERHEPIAIVGMGLRFPGDNDTPDGFAEFLRAGRSGIGPIPADRWDVAAFAAETPSGRGRIRTAGGGFLSGIDQFDPTFFDISPKEARHVDPQQRLVLETAWQALEHANLDATALRHGNGGVYVGVSNIDYALEASGHSYEDLDVHAGTGVANSAVSGRLSYFLGWRGPSISIDTACSSSLIAVHLATEGLRNRECDIALCAGVNVVHHPAAHVMLSQANMLSQDGYCKTFDDAADGYGRSEGCGAIVLKRLSDAQRDGDRVLALVRGCATRQDGASGGLTVPSGTAQETVMRAALAAAGLTPGDVQVVEAHGTGTPLGDPIEIGAISAVFGESHSTADPVLVASVKTNIGHTEPAAGVAGIIKTVLQMRDGVVYPHQNLRTPSRHIAWQDIPVRVPTALQPWIAPVRRALVNSFGFAGSIATVVLEQAPQRPAVAAGASGALGDERREHVFTLSAKNERSLRQQVRRYQRHLAGNPGVDVGTLCYTSNVGRAHWGTRVAAPVRDLADLIGVLERHLAGPEDSHDPGDGVRKVAFLFTGQGAQFPGMAAPLYRRYPVFRDHLDECDRLFTAHTGGSIRDLLLNPDSDAARLDETRHAQPALFMLEYAAAKLWMSWGVRPNVMVGHSIGELVAAAVAGLLGLEDAVALVSARARLMQSVDEPGGMLAVEAASASVAGLLGEYPDLAFAAVNAPDHCVVSGGARSLASFGARLAEAGTATKALRVSHAFHSPLMARIGDELRAATGDIRFREPELTLVSNLTGNVADPRELGTGEYWVRQVMEPVRFMDSIVTVARRGRHAFLELGPSATLIGLARRCVREQDHLWLPSTRRGDQDGSVARRSLCTLYRAGYAVSWEGYHQGRSGPKVDLPTYAFDRKRYWLPDQAPTARRSPADQPHARLLGRETSSDEQRASGVREFTAQVAPDQPGYLADHVVMGQVVFPGAAYVELLLALQDQVYGETRRPIHDLVIEEPLLLGSEGPVDVHTRLSPRPDGAARVEIFSSPPGADPALRRRLVTATIGSQPDVPPPLAQLAAQLPALVEAAGPAPEVEVDSAELYAGLADLGQEFGPEFQRQVRVARHGTDVAVGTVRNRDPGAGEYLPPPVLDAMLQSLALLLGTSVHLPVGMGCLQLLKRPKGDRLRSVARLRPDPSAGGDRLADFLLLEGDRPVLVLRELTVRRMTKVWSGPRRRLLHEQRWVRSALPRPGRRTDRRVVVVHPPSAAREALAAQAAAAGVRVSFAADATAAAGLLAAQPTDLCWFWQYGSAAPDGAGEGLPALCERNYRDLLGLLAVCKQWAPGDRRVWLVTEGAQWLDGDGDAAAGGERPDAGGEPPDADVVSRQESRLAASTVWGFGQSLGNEEPSLRVTLVDLQPGSGDYTPLLDEWLGESGDEFQLAFRNGHRHVRRIHAIANEPGEEHNLGLVIGEYGSVAGVTVDEVDDQPPGNGEIQIRVRAAGVNFKDVLNVLGMLREHAHDSGVEFRPTPLGFECAGTVVATGPGAEFEVGDEVLASMLGSMRRRVTVPSMMAVRKPANLTFAQAAAVPTAYTTAYHALHDLAGLKAGDRVLIHAAAGGVGQAAVALARLAGATVFATASRSKWEWLRDHGVADPMDSRSTDFAEEILRRTGGEGVDIVVNSLNKDRIPASLRALARNGRFVELGKIGVWSPEEVARVRPDVAYHVFDLAELPGPMVAPLTRRVLGEVTEAMSAGRLAPSRVTEYGLDEAAEAFGTLARGANVGKLVLRFAADERHGAPVTVDPDETYLITGGLGALGMATAGKLADLGARHLALCSRRAVTGEELAGLTRRLPPGVRVRAYQGDVADGGDVERVIAEIGRDGPRLGGIVHAAGVLADTPVMNLTWPRIDEVFRAKVYGTWHLHRAAASLTGLRFFVGYSSVASVIGSTAQANYAAGNAFIDGLMQWRAGHGLPALSINWGPWSGHGMAASLDERFVKGIEGQGMTFIGPADGTQALVHALGLGRPQVMVGQFDWDRLTRGRPFVNALYERVATRAQAAAERLDRQRYAEQDTAARHAMCNALIRERIARLLYFDSAQEVPPGATFVELGLDSLLAVELRNGLESLFQVPLPASAVLDHPTIPRLVEFIDGQLVPAEPGGQPDGAGAHPPASDAVAAVSGLAAPSVEAELAFLRDL